MSSRGEVSFLELFYDLVFVVVVSQAAGHLAGDVTWAGVGRFAVVFGLIWLAWINGAVYHDLHGRAEGRTRSYDFLQMGVLALLAVFTGQATAGDGPAFAVVYSAYLFLLGWLWYSVRRQDDPAFRPATTPYITGVLVSATVVGASALLPHGPRLAAWVLVVVGWLVGEVRSSLPCCLELTKPAWPPPPSGFVCWWRTPGSRRVRRRCGSPSQWAPRWLYRPRAPTTLLIMPTGSCTPASGAGATT